MKGARNFAHGAGTETDLTWRLWDLRTGCRIYRLEVEQVRALVSSMTKERRNDWVGWDPVREEWRPLFEFYDQTAGTERSENTQTAVGETIAEPQTEPSMPSRAADEESPGERTAIHGGMVAKVLTEENKSVQKPSERRRYKRLPVCVPAELRTDDYKVLMSTVDVSVGGLRFQERIPKRFTGPFTVRFLMGSATVEIKCEPIMTGNGECYRAKVIDQSGTDLMRLLMTEVLRLAETADDLEIR